jgi:hypothetical protein
MRSSVPPTCRRWRWVSLREGYGGRPAGLGRVPAVALVLVVARVPSVPVLVRLQLRRRPAGSRAGCN